MEQVVATDALEIKRAFIPAPENPDDWPVWREQLVKYRQDVLPQLGPIKIDLDAQSWAASCYAQGFIMLWDHELIDHDTGQWKVDSLLDRAEREFGGYDMVVLWCNYPLSGVDTRHQLAYYDELPGGRDALRAAVARFHARGVRVLIDHKPWVLGTPEGFATMEEAFVDLVKFCDLDGIYLDCSAGPEEDFRQMLEESVGRERVFISEAPARTEPFGDEIGSWQQFCDDSAAPGVHRNRWLNQRSIVYETRRYFYDPIQEIQRGWMNGAGQVIWENVFGYWAEYSPRYKTWLRLMLPALRRYGAFFQLGEWRPHLGGGKYPHMFVSEWRLNDQILWTIVNRRNHAIERDALKLPFYHGCRYFDIISGEEFPILEEIADENLVKVGGTIEREGIAGIVAVREVTSEFSAFLAAQRSRMAEADFSAAPWEGEHRKTTLVHRLRPVQATARKSSVPENMIALPNYEGWMVTRYRMRECGYIAGAVDEKHVYDGFEKTLPYSRWVKIENVALDAQPVTNMQFAEFLQASNYQPADQRNFLKHWTDRHPPTGKERHPVTYVSLEDARAYAAWAGKKLPREEEWQLAAQGLEKRIWPWGGTEWDSNRGNSGSEGTTSVDAFPNGRTPDGIWDLSGNTWDMTESERTDGHTRYQILKGGSFYEVKNSHWLFDTGAQPADWGAKHILLCDGWDRCATIGFRCAVDL